MRLGIRGGRDLLAPALGAAIVFAASLVYVLHLRPKGVDRLPPAGPASLESCLLQGRGHQRGDDPPPELKETVEQVGRVFWHGRCFEPTFARPAEPAFVDVGSVPMSVHPRGVAFHPDGRIALSEGHGTARPMRITFTSGEPVVNLEYDDTRPLPPDWRKVRSQRQRQGKFWFFGGPLAFDRAGAAVFALGSCSPNGLFRVRSAEPVDIEPLYEVEDTINWIQVPRFDLDHVYANPYRRGAIVRYSLADTREAPAPWFALQDAHIWSWLAVAPDRLIVTVRFRKVQEREMEEARREQAAGRPPIGQGGTLRSPLLGRRASMTTLLLDGSRETFEVLPEGFGGAMAQSRDGKTLVRLAAGRLVSFQLQR